MRLLRGLRPTKINGGEEQRYQAIKESECRKTSFAPAADLWTRSCQHQLRTLEPLETEGLKLKQGVTVDPSRFELVSLNLFLLNKKPLSVLVRFNFCKQKLNRTVYKN